MKTCFKCSLAKPVDQFYRHPRMGDGRLGKCIECTKADVAAHRQANHERICEYDRARFQKKERKMAIRRYRFAMRKRNPQKYAARSALSNAIRSGTVTKPSACQDCGASGCRIEGHHKDYSRPLDVVWVCFRCHRKNYHNQRVEVESF